WGKEFSCLCKTEDLFKARCTVCNKDFSILHRGNYDVKQHATGEMHIRNIKSKSSSQLINTFFVPEGSSEGDKVTAAELATVYHAIKHNFSSSSMDCSVKLTQKIFNDSSSIGKKLSCGRTKAESIVKNVLAPKAVSQVLLALPGDGKPLPFAIQTDASNKGNHKMFPIAVQFFTPQNGLLNRMIDFVENPDESANGTIKCIINSLENVEL
uniref:Uncharacterized protein n=1 Tax=Latimeria chalumnae TaxID=7897 RepID=H3B0R4_LATCH